MKIKKHGAIILVVIAFGILLAIYLNSDITPKSPPEEADAKNTNIEAENNAPNTDNSDTTSNTIKLEQQSVVVTPSNNSGQTGNAIVINIIDKKELPVQNVHVRCYYNKGVKNRRHPKTAIEAWTDEKGQCSIITAEQKEDYLEYPNGYYEVDLQKKGYLPISAYISPPENDIPAIIVMEKASSITGLIKGFDEYDLHALYLRVRIPNMKSLMSIDVDNERQGNILKIFQETSKCEDIDYNTGKFCVYVPEDTNAKVEILHLYDRYSSEMAEAYPGQEVTFYMKENPNFRDSIIKLILDDSILKPNEYLMCKYYNKSEINSFQISNSPEIAYLASGSNILYFKTTDKKHSDYYYKLELELLPKEKKTVYVQPIKAGRLTGQITDKDTGKPLSNITIKLIPANEEEKIWSTDAFFCITKTDRKGNYGIYGIKPGYYNFAVNPAIEGNSYFNINTSYKTTNFEATIYETQSTVKDIELYKK